MEAKIKESNGVHVGWRIPVNGPAWRAPHPSRSDFKSTTTRPRPPSHHHLQKHHHQVDRTTKARYRNALMGLSSTSFPLFASLPSLHAAESSSLPRHHLLPTTNRTVAALPILAVSLVVPVAACQQVLQRKGNELHRESSIPPTVFAVALIV